MSKGRGPTRLMSPRSTFHSVGSSSRLVLRRTDPNDESLSTSVTRPFSGSDLAASCGTLRVRRAFHNGLVATAETAPVARDCGPLSRRSPPALEL